MPDHGQWPSARPSCTPRTPCFSWRRCVLAGAKPAAASLHLPGHFEAVELSKLSEIDPKGVLYELYVHGEDNLTAPLP